MNYQETLDYLFSQLPMYQRIGAAAYKADMQPTIDLLAQLNNPYTQFKSIHVAGTNGKGSTSHMLASILQAAGYKVGLYTSPHLLDFRERIKINGVAISENAVVEFVEKNKVAFERIKPSFFEMSVAMAFQYFTDEKIDVAVIEVGMGGRLDSTNVITPELSIITNIGLDHTQFLGDTKAKIAAEKGGIIKAGIPVVIGETQAESRAVFEKIAAEKESPICFADQHFRIEIKASGDHLLHADVYQDNHLLYADMACELTGIYQKKNLATVFSALEILQSKFDISEANIRQGLAEVVTQTAILGRWQQLGSKPFIFCDTGHNEDGISEVLKQISLVPYEHLHLIFGVVNDKEVDKILGMLPRNASYYFCKANIPRALDQQLLQEKATVFQLQGNSYPSVELAIAAAKRHADKNDLIFIGGSTFVVADALLARLAC